MPTGPRVRLRPPRDADLGVLLAMRNDAVLQSQLMAHARPNDEAAVRAWLDRRLADPGAAFFVLADADSDRAVGFIQLLKLDPVSGHGELGIAVAPEAQGRGYGREALALLEAHAAGALGLRKILLTVLAANGGAIALYTRAGYREVGVLRQHYFHGGTYHDAQILEKLL
jgi:putative acetyltransferase